MAEEVTTTAKPRNWFRLAMRGTVSVSLGLLAAGLWWEYSPAIVARLFAVVGIQAG